MNKTTDDILFSLSYKNKEGNIFLKNLINELQKKPVNWSFVRNYIKYVKITSVHDIKDLSAFFYPYPVDLMLINTSLILFSQKQKEKDLTKFQSLYLNNILKNIKTISPLFISFDKNQNKDIVDDTLKAISLIWEFHKKCKQLNANGLLFTTNFLLCFLDNSFNPKKQLNIIENYFHQNHSLISHYLEELSCLSENAKNHSHVFVFMKMATCFSEQQIDFILNNREKFESIENDAKNFNKDDYQIYLSKIEKHILHKTLIDKQYTVKQHKI